MVKTTICTGEIMEVMAAQPASVISKARLASFLSMPKMRITPVERGKPSQKNRYGSKSLCNMVKQLNTRRASIYHASGHYQGYTDVKEVLEPVPGLPPDDFKRRKPVFRDLQDNPGELLGLSLFSSRPIKKIKRNWNISRPTAHCHPTNAPTSPSTTEVLAEQGTMVDRKVAISLSRLFSMIRQARQAGTLHPKAVISGRLALPCSPRVWQGLSIRKAILGR
jgi:hypothetical protein